MILKSLVAIAFSGAISAFAADKAELEKSLKDSALMYGAYGDESVICGGDVISYQIQSENDSEVVVKALITEQVNYCASEVQAECVGIYQQVNGIYQQKSFNCDI